MTEPHSIKKFSGLCASMNTVGDAIEGAAEIADNCVIRSRNVKECRRGYSATTAAGGPLNALAFKEGQAIALTYDTPSNTGTLRAYNPATQVWTTLPMTPGGLTLDKPGVGVYPHTRFVSANKSLYFQSKYGMAKVESLASGVSRAAIQPPNLIRPRWTVVAAPNSASTTEVSSAASPGPTWLADGSWVAYRVTLARYGANNELIESEPSERLLTIDHTAGTGAVNVNFTPRAAYMTPPDAFYRVYRSAQVLLANNPSDEMFLVLETPVSTTTSLNGFVTLGLTSSLPIDVAADTSLKTPLYTNPYSGNGIAAANTQAALSADLAWFKNRLHLLNTSDVQRVLVRVVGTGTGGIAEGDQITIAGAKFTFTASATAGDANKILLFTSGTVAQNIANTARDMVSRVNWWFIQFAATGSQSTVYPNIPSSVMAQYVSTTDDDAGGLVLFRSVLPGTPTFTVQTSSATGWDRNYTGGKTSDPNAQAAGWMWSNISQPEGVPTANNNQIGDQNAAGYRVIALKETLFAFKADGLWKITDDGSQLGPQLQLVDPTIKLVAPETAVALDNFILALADQGVVLITETGGVLNISHTQIERELFKLMAYVGPTALGNLAFGIAYQPEHTYVLALPESPNATACTVQYVYNLQTQTWTRWTLPGVLSGAVHPDTGQLYWGRSDGTLWIERKNMDSTDYQDPGFTIASPTATQTASLVFTGDLRTGATPFAVGDVVQQWQATYALAQRVIGVAYSSQNNQTTVTLDKAPSHAWNQIVNLTVVKAVIAVAKFLPIHAGEPLTDKNWENAYVSFRFCDLDFMTVGWSSEKYPITVSAIERVNDADGSSDAPIRLEKWGTGTWGSRIWGRQAKDVVIKCTMPQEFDHSAQLTLTLTFPCALSRFELNAIDLKISGGSDRVVR